MEMEKKGLRTTETLGLQEATNYKIRNYSSQWQIPKLPSGTPSLFTKMQPKKKYLLLSYQNKRKSID